MPAFRARVSPRKKYENFLALAGQALAALLLVRRAKLGTEAKPSPAKSHAAVTIALCFRGPADYVFS
jgi:hypothetical protein